MSETQDTATRPTRQFVAEDAERLKQAMAEIEQFREFVLRRFIEYTDAYTARDTHGRSVGLVESVRDPGGWGSWGITTHHLLNPENGLFRIEHTTYNEHRGNDVDLVVQMPAAFVYGDMERDDRYAQYLALKAEFEPDN